MVKLPFSIHSTGIFLGVYFWQSAILGAGRARGEGKRNRSNVAAWEPAMAGGGWAALVFGLWKMKRRGPALWAVL